MEKTTATQFQMWQAFLEWEVNSFHREDHYFAMLASEIRKSTALSTSVGKIHLGDYLLNFEPKIIESVPKDPPSKEDILNTKRKFFHSVGLHGINAPKE